MRGIHLEVKSANEYSLPRFGACMHHDDANESLERATATSLRVQATHRVHQCDVCTLLATHGATGAVSMRATYNRKE
jgi:hypothetical protein